MAAAKGDASLPTPRTSTHAWRPGGGHDTGGSWRVRHEDSHTGRHFACVVVAIGSPTLSSNYGYAVRPSTPGAWPSTAIVTIDRHAVARGTPTH